VRDRIFLKLNLRFRQASLVRDIAAAGRLQRFIMLTVYDCIVSEHDLRLVALAALVCALASLTAVNLLHHVRGSGRSNRIVWRSLRPCRPPTTSR
jgi:hypothetical protein